MVRPFYTTGEFEVAELGGRRALDEIEMLLTAFDCVLPDDSGVYCSSDVTTGRRLYFEVYAGHGVRSSEELKDRLGPEAYAEVKGRLIRDNIARGVEFTEGLRARGLTNLVNPGPLTAPGFTQQHYHYLWECVIIKKIHTVYFNDGWEYSNGCTLEYAVGRRKGAPVHDHLGNDIPPAAAAEMVRRALADLGSRGIAAPMLERHLQLITELR